MNPPLNPDVALYLMERYPGRVTRAGLLNMWVAAWSFIEERVPAHRMARPPAVFEAVAILRVQHICAHGDAQAKQAFNYAAVELLAPYC